MKPHLVCLLFSLGLGTGLLAQSTAPTPAAGGGANTVAPAPALVLSGTVTPIPFPTDTIDAEYARRAGVEAIRQWMTEFIGRGVGPKRFAVLPLARDIDGGYFTEQARNAFAEASGGTGYALFTRDDATWNALLEEIRRGDQLGDTMDPATIQQFGRIQGVEGVIVGRISGVFSGTARTGAGGIVTIEGDGRVIQVRVSLQAYAVETGQLLWGGERTGSAVMPIEQLVIKRDWIIKGALYGVGGFVALIVLWLLLGRMKSANRPR